MNYFTRGKNSSSTLHHKYLGGSADSPSTIFSVAKLKLLRVATFIHAGALGMQLRKARIKGKALARQQSKTTS
jgi:hypothetical protein